MRGLASVLGTSGLRLLLLELWVMNFSKPQFLIYKLGGPVRETVLCSPALTTWTTPHRAPAWSRPSLATSSPPSAPPEAGAFRLPPCLQISTVAQPHHGTGGECGSLPPAALCSFPRQVVAKDWWWGCYGLSALPSPGWDSAPSSVAFPLPPGLGSNTLLRTRR